jgi:hypothetical protein
MRLVKHTDEGLMQDLLALARAAARRDALRWIGGESVFVQATDDNGQVSLTTIYPASPSASPAPTTSAPDIGIDL